MLIKGFVVAIVLLLANCILHIESYKVVYAVNAGGDEHLSSDGILFEKDTLQVGTASDYGKNLLGIGRAGENDEILYQTERYHTSTFGYDLPASSDGDYVLILKFCEVYFNSPNSKVFDIALNGDLTVVNELDIFALVGHGTAHDEYIYFSISQGKIYYKDEESEIRGRKIRVEFIKGYRDNPKINAIVLIKGNVENIQKLQPLNIESSSEAYDKFVEEAERPAKMRKTSGPKQPNPYSLDDSNWMLPIFVALGLFVPLLYCLCKL